MTDLGMNFDTNDLDIQNGDMYLVDSTVAIQQDLQQRLQVWLGEWFLDTTVGLPYRQQILVKNPNMDLVHAYFVDAVTNTPGITEIINLSMSYDNSARSLSVSVQAQTSTGQTIQAQATVSPQVQNGTIEGTPYP